MSQDLAENAQMIQESSDVTTLLRWHRIDQMPQKKDRLHRLDRQDLDHAATEVWVQTRLWSINSITIDHNLHRYDKISIFKLII